jgi:nucleotide-binding universal stress UspA family protein
MVTYSNILFCTDFSENAGAAVSRAVDLAKKYGAVLHILHVYQEPGHIAEYEISSDATIDWLAISHLMGAEMQERLKSLWEAVTAEVGSCQCKMLRGKAPEMIVYYAKEAKIDLIVMATHALRGLEQALFGSTAVKVLKDSPCSVLVIRAP